MNTPKNSGVIDKLLLELHLDKTKAEGEIDSLRVYMEDMQQLKREIAIKIKKISTCIKDKKKNTNRIYKNTKQLIDINIKTRTELEKYKNKYTQEQFEHHQCVHEILILEEELEEIENSRINTQMENEELHDENKELTTRLKDLQETEVTVARDKAERLDQLKTVMLAGTKQFKALTDMISTMSVLTGAEELKEGLCVACKDQKSSVVFVPCGHICVCEDCSRMCEVCPYCRSSYADIVKVYKA